MAYPRSRQKNGSVPWGTETAPCRPGIALKAYPQSRQKNGSVLGGAETVPLAHRSALIAHRLRSGCAPKAYLKFLFGTSKLFWKRINHLENWENRLLRIKLLPLLRLLNPLYTPFEPLSGYKIKVLKRNPVALYIIALPLDITYAPGYQIWLNKSYLSTSVVRFSFVSPTRLYVPWVESHPEYSTCCYTEDYFHLYVPLTSTSKFLSPDFDV